MMIIQIKMSGIIIRQAHLSTVHEHKNTSMQAQTNTSRNLHSSLLYIMRECRFTNSCPVCLCELQQGESIVYILCNIIHVGQISYQQSGMDFFQTQPFHSHGLSPCVCLLVSLCLSDCVWIDACTSEKGHLKSENLHPPSNSIHYHK